VHLLQVPENVLDSNAPYLQWWILDGIAAEVERL